MASPPIPSPEWSVPSCGRSRMAGRITAWARNRAARWPPRYPPSAFWNRRRRSCPAAMTGRSPSSHRPSRLRTSAPSRRHRLRYRACSRPAAARSRWSRSSGLRSSLDVAGQIWGMENTPGAAAATMMALGNVSDTTVGFGSDRIRGSGLIYGAAAAGPAVPVDKSIVFINYGDAGVSSKAGAPVETVPSTASSAKGFSKLLRNPAIDGSVYISNGSVQFDNLVYINNGGGRAANVELIANLTSGAHVAGEDTQVFSGRITSGSATLRLPGIDTHAGANTQQSGVLNLDPLPALQKRRQEILDEERVKNDPNYRLTELKQISAEIVAIQEVRAEEAELAAEQAGQQSNSLLSPRDRFKAALRKIFDDHFRSLTQEQARQFLHGFGAGFVEGVTSILELVKSIPTLAQEAAQAH